MFNVYHRNDDGTLGQFQSNKDDHADAILDVEEELVATGVGYNKPVLAVIVGGKNV